jgi:hypothetical protein
MSLQEDGSGHRPGGIGGEKERAAGSKFRIDSDVFSLEIIVYREPWSHGEGVRERVWRVDPTCWEVEKLFRQCREWLGELGLAVGEEGLEAPNKVQLTPGRTDTSKR